MSSFSVDDFRKWISEKQELSNFFNIQPNEGNEYDQFIGRETQSKVGGKKLFQKMEVNQGHKKELVMDFLENGGTITGVDGENCLVETTTGSFYVPRFCLKIRKN
jgi:hypothetical protein